MGKTARPAKVEDLLFVDEMLTHLLSHGLIKAFLPELVRDFSAAYVEFNSGPIDEKLDDKSIEALRIHKTELFQAFVTGAVWARNPDSQFGQKCEKHLPKKEEEKPKIIL